MSLRILLILLSLPPLVLFRGSGVQQDVGPQKRALLVGVHDYSHGDILEPYPNLNTLQDIEAIRNVLSDPRFGFKDIRILTTKAETTHRRIVDEFEKLIRDTNKDDIVFFHFAGHGSQVPAMVDKNEPDGLDQTLVPSDWNLQKADPKDPIKHSYYNEIVDDEIGQLLDRLKLKEPASVMLSFDCCHSGLNTRGGDAPKVRGRNPSFPVPKPDPATVPPRARSRGAGGLFAPEQPKQNGFVAISACRFDEKAVEFPNDKGKMMGRLSYYLAKALLESGPQTTYQDVFERINSFMFQKFPDQHPQIEGDTRKPFFGGKVQAPERYIQVVVGKDGKAHLNAGMLQGMTEGSVFSLYERNTTDFKTAKPKTEAVIEYVDLTESRLTIKTAGIKPDPDLQAARAVETRHRFLDNAVKVDLKDIVGDPRAASIVMAVKSLEADGGMVKVMGANETADLFISRNDASGSRGAAGYAIRRLPEKLAIRHLDMTSQSEVSDAVKQALEREARIRFLRSLENPNRDSLIKVEMRIVPCKVKFKDPGDPDTAEFVADDPAGLKRSEGGQTVLRVDDFVTIQVRVSGENDAFVSVIDLPSDSSVNGLFPPRIPGLHVNNKFSPREKWQYLTIGGRPVPIHITLPVGAEMFKLIATPMDTDFTAVLDVTRGPESRESKDPLGRLIFMSTQGRRAQTSYVPTKHWCAWTVAFVVVPKEARTGKTP